MLNSIKNIFLNNVPLKLCSLILGFSFWIFFNQWHTQTKWFKASLCFYEIPNHMMITAPESIEVALHGKRSDLKCIDDTSLALHICAHSLHEGKNPLIVDNSILFLPNTIKLVHYSPINNIIIVTNKNAHEQNNS